MKITGVRTQLYEIELTRPIGDANSPKGCRRVASLAVFVDSDEGLTGVSFGSPGARGQIHGMVENLLVGRDPRGVRGLWKRMVDHVFKGGNRGIVGDALSAIDVALWDLKAKANNEPLWKTLGASTRCVKAYASGMDLSLSDEELRAYYEGMARKGISAGKLKVGLDPELDLQRIGIMQQALATSGKEPVLMIDANEYWSAKQAIRHIRSFEERYDLTWVEEPARRWDYRALRKVSQSVRAAVATGENLDEIGDFMPLIANEAVDIVEVGSGTSGITGALQIAELAYAFELPVSMMNCPANYHGAPGGRAAQPHHDGSAGGGPASDHARGQPHRGRVDRAGRCARVGHRLRPGQAGGGHGGPAVARCGVNALGPPPWGRAVRGGARRARRDRRGVAGRTPVEPTPPRALLRPAAPSFRAKGRARRRSPGSLQ